MSDIRAIEIDGLNGKTNLRINLKGKHCIIVGPNGSGKSTALQIVALAMGRQWPQLTKMRFNRLTLHFDKGSYSLSREACGSSFGSPNAPIKFTRFFQRITELNLFEEFIASDLDDQSQYARFVHIAPLTRVDIRNAQRVARTRFPDQEGYSEINVFQKGLNSLGIPRTIYLPTYRRIELELARLTSRFPEYMQRDFAESINTKFDTEFYEEIVRFGMDDVASSLKSFETKTRDFSRNRFNKMMSSYLKEMANSQSISINDLRSFDIDEDRIQTVLSRIEEGILSESEKAEISNIVLSMAKPQKGGGHPPFHKRWLSHFFVRLLEVDSDIRRLEKPVTELVAILKKYVAPNNVSYDIESYHFSVTDIYGDEIALTDLSSGEKQLLSLIALLQLSRRQRANVFIDEPELSLSVPWQYDFLPDISITGACNQIFAVTHSPFIYDNKLAESVVDFLECSSPKA